MLSNNESDGKFSTELNTPVRSCHTSPFQINILPVLFVIRHILIFSLRHLKVNEER